MSEKAKVITREKVAGRPKLLVTQAVTTFSYCSGCNHPLVARAIAEAIDELNMGDKAVSVYGIGCSDFLYYILYIDTIFGPHGRAPDIATAAKRAYPDNLVFVIEGDGALMAIGAESFLGALTRSEKITVIMCNNTVYGTTGGQLAPTTLVGQVTGTTPEGREPMREGFPTHTAEMVATFKGAAYSARGAFNSPYNYERTRGYIKTAFQKQIDKVGLSFVEVLCACPTNWHLSPELAMKHVEERLIPEFPLGEFKNVDKIE